MADHLDKHNGELHQHNLVPEPKGYALSGKIMLSAIIILFAVVVIMVCLHIYARWYILRARRRQIRRARRRTHLVFYIEPDNPSNIIPIPSQGLEASVLKALPTFTYVADKSDEEEGGVEVLECAVCLSEFEEKEKGRLLPKCKHCFHVECIDMWFHSHDTCPLCRAPVEAGDVPASTTEAHVAGDEVAELIQSQPGELSQEVGESQGESSSLPPSSVSIGERRKGLDLAGMSAIEVPRRSQSFCFPGSSSTEFGSSCSPGNGFKSPTSRILSLKRILSREKRSPLPSPSGASCSELDIESGWVGSSSSQALTPR